MTNRTKPRDGELSSAISTAVVHMLAERTG
jgi:hypothetical protein